MENRNFFQKIEMTVQFQCNKIFFVILRRSVCQILIGNVVIYFQTGFQKCFQPPEVFILF